MPQSKAKQRACPKGTRSYVRFQVQQSPSVQNVGWRGLLGLFAALAPEQSKAAREREIDTDICCPQPLKPQASKQDTEIEKQRERERKKDTIRRLRLQRWRVQAKPQMGWKPQRQQGARTRHLGKPAQPPPKTTATSRCLRSRCGGGENVGMVRQCEPSSRSSSVSK